MNKTCLIDLDGTMYCGDTLIEGAKRFIDWNTSPRFCS